MRVTTIFGMPSFTTAARTQLPTDDTEVEPIAVAKILQKIAEKVQPDMVIMGMLTFHFPVLFAGVLPCNDRRVSQPFTGKQAIDDDSCASPQMLAALMDWPQVTFLRLATCSCASYHLDRLQPNRDDRLPVLHSNLCPLPATGYFRVRCGGRRQQGEARPRNRRRSAEPGVERPLRTFLRPEVCQPAD